MVHPSFGKSPHLSDLSCPGSKAAETRFSCLTASQPTRISQNFRNFAFGRFIYLGESCRCESPRPAGFARFAGGLAVRGVSAIGPPNYLRPDGEGAAMPNGWRARLRDQSGMAVLAILAICILLGMVGLGVDLGHLFLVKSELQRAAEAGAIAGVRALFPDQLDTAPANLTPQCADALSRANGTALSNRVDGGNPIIAAIQVGRWDWPTSQFTPGCSADPATFSNAVMVTTQIDNLAMFFIRALGIGPTSLAASSIAVMDWVGALHPGAGFVLALKADYAKAGDIKIYLNPDKDDNGGWYAKDPAKPDADIIKGYLDNPATIPAIQKGDLINLDNGVMQSAIDAIGSSYLNKTVWLPVVDTDDFNKSATVLGFTAFLITGTGQDSGQGGKKYISGAALTLNEAPGTLSDPNGANYGLLTSPRLVK